MKKIMPAVFVVISFSSFAQNFDVEQIPASLLENANSVVRYYHTEIERHAVNKLSINVSYAITILNPKGEQEALLNVFYDNLIRVENISGRMYDKHGKFLSKISKDQMNDYSYMSAFSLYEDNRVIHVDPHINDYPITLQYSYKTIHHGVLHIASWFPLQSLNQSVERASLVYKTNSDIDFKFIEQNHNFKCHKTEAKEKESYYWEINNFKAVEYEMFSPVAHDFLPNIILSPLAFEYNGSSGEFTDWKSYGKWVYLLVEGRDKLPQETIDHVLSITSGETDKYRLIDTLYKYMQSKTRYVNISLGIGGFQPMEASKVDEVGYGDCKALSNYTKALLKIVGIESYYTEIGSGDFTRIRYDSFASADQTNHIILCIPLEEDTIWLECTNQHIPTGFLGYNSINRKALIVKPDGGEIVNTPYFDYRNNISSTISDVNIYDNNSIDATLQVTYKNMEFSTIFSLLSMTKGDQKKYLIKNSPIKNITIETFKISEESNLEFAGILEMKFSASSITSSAGKRIFIKPNLYHENDFNIESKDRYNDIFIMKSYTRFDTILFKIPEHYKIEYTPDIVKLNTAFGSYEYAISESIEGFILIRKYIQKSGTFDKTLLPELVAFYNAIMIAEKQDVILLKK